MHFFAEKLSRCCKIISEILTMSLAEIVMCKTGFIEHPISAILKIIDAVGRLAFSSGYQTAFTPGHFHHCQQIAREVDLSEDRVLNVTPRRLTAFPEMRSGKPVAELADF